MNEADFLRALSESMRRATERLVAEHKEQLAAALARAEQERFVLAGIVRALAGEGIEFDDPDSLQGAIGRLRARAEQAERTAAEAQRRLEEVRADLRAALRCCSVEGCHQPATRRRPSQYLPDCCDAHDDTPGLRSDTPEADEVRAALRALEDGT